MKAYQLLTSQKNDVIKAIERSGLRPDEFRWGHVSSIGGLMDESLISVSTLTHKPSGNCVIFDIRDNVRGVKFTPGSETAEEVRICRVWGECLACVSDWLGYLGRELAAPDLWSEVYERRQEIESATASDAPNTPFTPSEQKLIAEQLTEIHRNLVATHQLHESQANLLNEQFEWLKREARTQGRKTWFLTLIGSALSWTMTGLLEPEVAKHVFRQLLDAFIPIFSRLLQSGTP